MSNHEADVVAVAAGSAASIAAAEGGARGFSIIH
jgi:hypothetical protein